MNKKIENYGIAIRYGQDAAFVANVILTSHQKPGRRIAGLVKLLKAGRSVRAAQFNMDVLLVDGNVYPWAKLETAR